MIEALKLFILISIYLRLKQISKLKKLNDLTQLRFLKNTFWSLDNYIGRNEIIWRSINQAINLNPAVFVRSFNCRHLIESMFEFWRYYFKIYKIRNGLVSLSIIQVYTVYQLKQVFVLSLEKLRLSHPQVKIHYPKQLISIPAHNNNN